MHVLVRGPENGAPARSGENNNNLQGDTCLGEFVIPAGRLRTGALAVVSSMLPSFL